MGAPSFASNATGGFIPTYELTKLAAELHAEHKLLYADCFAASLASQRKASLATRGKDFAKLERRLTILCPS